jgi:hypothetical protein
MIGRQQLHGSSSSTTNTANLFPTLIALHGTTINRKKRCDDTKKVIECITVQAYLKIRCGCDATAAAIIVGAMVVFFQPSGKR